MPLILNLAARFLPKMHSMNRVLCRKGKGGLGEIRLCAFGSLTAADEQPADGLIPPQTSTSDVLQCVKAAHSFIFQDG